MSWDCDKCGQSNADWATTCGRCEDDRSVRPKIQVTKDEWDRFYSEWRSGKYPFLRLGQAFINKFWIEGAVPDPDLFHANTEQRATELARKYIAAHP